MRNEGEDPEVTAPRPAADLLREAGYELPDSRRRRRRERTGEFTLPPAPERMMFPYRRPTDIDRAQERTQPAPPELTRPSRPPVIPPVPPPAAAKPVPARTEPPRTQPSRTQPPRTQVPRIQVPPPPVGGVPPEWTDRSRLTALPPIPDRQPVPGQPVPGQPYRSGRASHQAVREPRSFDPDPIELATAELRAVDLPGTELRRPPLQPVATTTVPPAPAADRVNGAAAPDRTRPPELHPQASGRSLVRDWVLFLVQTLLAAGLGLGLWLGFHTLWQTQAYVAAASSGVVLVGLHTMASWIRRRQTGGELDLFTSAVVVAVGVTVTVLPAAFALQPA